MGDTKAELRRPFWLARIITAGILIFVGLIAALQIIIPPNLTVRFKTGIGAQQVNAVHVRKGGSVDLPTPLKPGAYFVGWSLSSDSGETISDLKNVKRDTTLYAVWDSVEKFGVLMVNGVSVANVNIFKASDDGVSATELNERWLIEDDYHISDDSQTLKRIANPFDGSVHKVALKYNFQKFLGWEYLNADGFLNQLRYDDGIWTLYEANGTVSQITDTNLFYPPNYKTTFNALLSYRDINITFYNYDNLNNAIALPTDRDDRIYAPQYSVNENIATEKFSHWEVVPGDLWDYAPENIDPNLLKLSLMPGERIVVDPSWYYLGYSSKIAMTRNADTNEDVVTIGLAFRACEWHDNSDKYTMQVISDAEDGVQKKAIPEGAVSDLSVTNPIVMVANSLWLYKDENNEITTYSFYDHEGSLHQIPTNRLETSYTQIRLGERLSLTNESEDEKEEIYFNRKQAINIKVNYASAAKDITLYFNYGEGLHVLPNYKASNGEIVMVQANMNIGNEIVLPNAERYLKNDSLFYGWRLQDDPENKIYFAGQKYTIPHLSDNELTFIAEWREARLLFNFVDYDGRDLQWPNGELPNFKIMKGSAGNTVPIIKNIPERFGYNFAGWLLNGTVRQPGENIIIGSDINVLQAVWTPKNINVVFKAKDDASGELKIVATTSAPFGEEITLSTLTQNNYFEFNGWRLGNQVITAPSIILDLATVTILDPVANGNELNVVIEAAQLPRKAVVVCHLPMDLTITTEIRQGEQFYQYDPINRQPKDLDIIGQQFKYWEFNYNNQTELVRIEEQTTVPLGALLVNVYGVYQQKQFVIKYQGVDGEIYCPEHQTFEKTPCGTATATYYTYGATVDLLTRGQIAPLATIKDGWGNFVGWSFEKDKADANPAVIYNVVNEGLTKTQLQLASENDMYTAPYQIKIDEYSERLDTAGEEVIYQLTLHAVYAHDAVSITYLDYYGHEHLKITSPVFMKGDNRQVSVLGGTTVDPSESDFAEYGLIVLDDQGLEASGKNFVGWRVQSLGDIDPDVKAYFENRLWFPGDILPAINFNLTFVPESVAQYNTKTINVGTSTYVAQALPRVTGDTFKKMTVGDAIDILALPAGDYTIPTDALTILKPITRVIVPANGAITLEPKAIHADSLTTFYVSDNVTVNGNPVVGAAFNTYRVNKNYYEWNSTARTVDLVAHSTGKYNFAAALQGLLVTEQTLLALPAHTALSTDDLLACLTTFHINHLASYALNEINSLSEINLAIDNLQIDEKAIFTTSAKTLRLPANSTAVDPDCLAGYHARLRNIYFGAADETTADYAFVRDQVLYYGNTKNYIMFVLPDVALRRIDQYNDQDLLIPASVTGISPYALGSLPWHNINSITADNAGQNINLAALYGVPGDDLPKFVHPTNQYLDYAPSVQVYEKILVFKFNGYKNVELKVKYNQPFALFDPKENNPYGFTFDRPWYKFAGWVSGNEFFEVKDTDNEVYYVGVNGSKLHGNYRIEFNANEERSWRSYPIRFHVFDGTKYYDTEINIPTFEDDYQHQYTIGDIISNPSLLSQLYLPGLQMETPLTYNGTSYQFVGWGAKLSAPASFDDWLWQNNVDNRILPNRTDRTRLNAGNSLNNVYNYYALYDKVTPNLKFNLLYDIEQGSISSQRNKMYYYEVEYNSNSTVDKIHIPYAHYNTESGYMAPVMKIKNSGFAGLGHIKEVVIGDGVREIGAAAFKSVSANVTFNHQGANIQINHDIRHLYQLRIGSQAFMYNGYINSFNLPEVVSEIGDEAFAECSQLRYFRLPEDEEHNIMSSLNYLGDFVFRNDTAMAINGVIDLINKDNSLRKRFNDIGEGVFMNTQVTNSGRNIVWIDTLLHACGSSGRVVVSQHVKGYAFANMSNITSITIDNSLVKVYANAFAALSNTVTQIDLTNANIDLVINEAFNGMPDLTIKVLSIQNWTKKFPGVKGFSSN